ncbi:hypothetical protein T440DRAFT_382961 [Plenodomus tracheiphilus IPT5]|uniref:C2H2-type domain-containing protein n=1 Tax=Plenodomus tracheiphilus IPT5 TaxID=1408161 RepID=A0A6A7BND2_9PLEO|nr:hypothetical protein T440DRAFT_382961 [Plenodomus tracheiphilus IPT5]
MAPKRKIYEDAGSVSPKRPRTSKCAEDKAHESDTASDDSGDYRTNYTDNGTRRAESEARRQWNYICPVESCAQRFNRPCRLEAHMRSHNKERPFACTAAGCDKTFPRKDHLQRHIKNAHGDPVIVRSFTCDWKGCGKSFTSNGRLQRHKDVHESKFYCTEFPPCNEHFRKAKALTAHIKSQHLEVKPYPCNFVDHETGDKCTSGFQTEGALQRHMIRLHTEGQEAGHFCLLCMAPDTEMQTTENEDEASPLQPVSFATNEELVAHTEECHPPVCAECGHKFKNASTLKSHFDTVHADPAEQPQFTCPRPDCDSVFNRRHNLTVHIQTVHEQQFRYFCNPDALQTSKHDDLKAWNGHNACGAAFKAKSSLDQHVRTHHLGLGNRKQLRKAAKSKKKPDPSTLTLLTGIGYEKGREVSCLIPSCEFRFYMDRDLRRHLRAAHNVPEDEVEEMIIQRNAMTGGQFWIGGLDESMSIFESAEPSMPQTPTPYFSDAGVMMSSSELMPHDNGFGKASAQQFGYFDNQFDHLALMNGEDADMDFAMGLGELGPAADVQEGLLWDTLAPVEQFNHTHE